MDNGSGVGRWTMEYVKDYTNVDFHNKSYEEFCERLDVVPFSIRDSNFTDQLEWALLLLNFKYNAIRHSEAADHAYNLGTFDGAWLPCIPDDHDWKMLHPDSYTADFAIDNLWSGNFNFKIMNIGNNRALLHKISTLDMAQKRHICNHTDTALRIQLAFATKDEKWYTHSQNFKTIPLIDHPSCREKLIKNLTGEESVFAKEEVEFLLKQKKSYLLKRFGDALFPISNKPGYSVSAECAADYMKTADYWDTHKVYKGCSSIALSMSYEWAVYFKESGSKVGIKMPILPENTKEVFSLRDIPEGEMQRKALCNFVKQHVRTTKAKEDTVLRQTLVKQHLRGETKFRWRGLDVHIIPSAYDLSKVKTTKKFLKV
jgi:hypothetical protein